VRGRLSGFPATEAGPRRRDGVSRRPTAAVSVNAATAPCAQENLMSSPDLADNYSWDELSAASAWVLRT